MDKEDREQYTYLRNAYPSLLITGPFSIIFGFENGFMALNDRLKLRSMVVGEKDDMVYIASEECAIREIEPNVDKIMVARGRRTRHRICKGRLNA
jgi:glutamate synthase domain-containing protein 1